MQSGCNQGGAWLEVGGLGIVTSWIAMQIQDDSSSLLFDVMAGHGMAIVRRRFGEPLTTDH